MLKAAPRMAGPLTMCGSQMRGISLLICLPSSPRTRVGSSKIRVEMTLDSIRKPEGEPEFLEGDKWQGNVSLVNHI